MLRNSADGLEIGFPGRFRADSHRESFKTAATASLFPIRIRTKSGSEARFAARKHYGVRYISFSTTLGVLAAPPGPINPTVAGYFGSISTFLAEHEFGTRSVFWNTACSTNCWFIETPIFRTCSVPENAAGTKFALIQSDTSKICILCQIIIGKISGVFVVILAQTEVFCSAQNIRRTQ